MIRPLNVLTLIFLTLSSCVTIYFDQPQPADAKDLSRTPRSIRGTWIIDFDTVVISKHTFYWADWMTDTITAEEVDSNPDIEIRDGYIYDLTEEPPVGYTCTPLDAAWLIYLPERISHELGDSALLRKVNRDYFAFNRTGDGEWWEVFLVERNGRGVLSIWYPAKKDVCLMEAVGAGAEQYLPEDEDPGTAFTNDFHRYWSVELTRKKLLECFDLGAFGELVLKLDADSRR
jgi:hypothetical protein